jgi:hypothetical protein
MEIKKLLYRKEMKIVTLLLTSLLIASASAAVYYSLSMTSTITTATNDVYFITGVDAAAAGTSIFNNNKSATLASLKAYPNMTMSYDDPIKVWNNNGATSFNVRLRPVSRTGDAQYFSFINFTLQTTTKISLNYTSNGVSWTDPSTSGWATVSANTGYAIVVQTRASSTATSGQVASIEIAIDVEQ